MSLFRMTVKSWLLAGLLGFSGVVQAGDLKAPFELENSAVLPAGVRNPRFKDLLMSVSTRFNDGGLEEGLGQRLNKTVTWGDILDAQEDDAQRATVRGLLDKSGLSENGSPGATTGVVNTYANIKVPVLAVGVTSKLTLAVAVPVVNVEVSADTAFTRSEDGQAFVAAATDTSPAKGSEAAAKLNDAVNQKLKRLGYEPIRSMNVSGVGDIKAVAKYNVYSNDQESVSFKSEMTMPTGTAPNVSRALDVPLGDGQWDLGAGVIYDRRLARDLRWNLFGSYIMQLSDHLDRHLPVSDSDSLSADVERVNRNLGDQVSVGSSLSYFFPSTGLTLGGGYSFQFQTRTTFDGSLFSPERYQYLEHLFPLQSLHSMTLTTGFSTVEWFKQKKFRIPLQANIGFSHPILGRNVTTNDVLSGELVLFF